MFFIGIISKRNEFEELKKSFNYQKEITVLNINSNSIENYKTIKFDAILMIDSIEKLENSSIEKMCENLKYLIINSDLEMKNEIFSNIRANIISFGINHKSTVTFSSISDEKVIISVQRSFENKIGKTIEVGEYSLEIDKKENTNLHNVLAKYIIKKLYFIE